MPHRWLTIEEMAARLHWSVRRVEELVRRREIPHEVRGGRLMFRCDEVDGWASRRILEMSPGGLREHVRGAGLGAPPAEPRVSEMVRPDGVFPAMESRTRAGVLRDLVAAADRTGLVNYPDDLLEGLLERERMASTALPGGLAIPHPARQDPYGFEESFVLLARTVQPIPFGSPDGELTDLFFLMCCKEEGLHLRLLARLCMLCHHTSLLLRLRETRDPRLMHEVLRASEQELDAAPRRERA